MYNTKHQNNDDTYNSSKQVSYLVLPMLQFFALPDYCFEETLHTRTERHPALGSFASQEFYMCARSFCCSCAENCGDRHFSVKRPNSYCGDLRRRRIHAKASQKTLKHRAREIPYTGCSKQSPCQVMHSVILERLLLGYPALIPRAVNVHHICHVHRVIH